MISNGNVADGRNIGKGRGSGSKPGHSSSKRRATTPIKESERFRSPCIVTDSTCLLNEYDNDPNVDSMSGTGSHFRERSVMTPNVLGKGRCAAFYRAAPSDRRERP